MTFVNFPADILNLFRHALIRFNHSFHPRDGTGDGAELLNFEEKGSSLLLTFVKQPADILNFFSHSLIRFNLPLHPRNGIGDGAVLLDVEVLADVLQAVAFQLSGKIDGDVAGIVGDSASGCGQGVFGDAMSRTRKKGQVFF